MHTKASVKMYAWRGRAQYMRCCMIWCGTVQLNMAQHTARTQNTRAQQKTTQNTEQHSTAQEPTTQAMQNIQHDTRPQDTTIHYSTR